MSGIICLCECHNLWPFVNVYASVLKYQGERVFVQNAKKSINSR